MSAKLASSILQTEILLGLLLHLPLRWPDYAANGSRWGFTALVAVRTRIEAIPPQWSCHVRSTPGRIVQSWGFRKMYFFSFITRVDPNLGVGSHSTGFHRKTKACLLVSKGRRLRNLF